MEYVYAAMLLHKAKKEIKEESVKKVLEAAGVQVDEARVKALVASLEGVNIDEAVETYELMSKKYFTHATPTLFNAGTPKPQLSSCFLLTMKADSIDGIYDTLKDCALISKSAGGIGLHIHNIRASGAPIIGTNGISNYNLIDES